MYFDLVEIDELVSGEHEDNGTFFLMFGDLHEIPLPEFVIDENGSFYKEDDIPKFEPFGGIVLTKRKEVPKLKLLTALAVGAYLYRQGVPEVEGNEDFYNEYLIDEFPLVFTLINKGDEFAQFIDGNLIECLEREQSLLGTYVMLLDEQGDGFQENKELLLELCLSLHFISYRLKEIFITPYDEYIENNFEEIKEKLEMGGLEEYEIITEEFILSESFIFSDAFVAMTLAQSTEEGQDLLKTMLSSNDTDKFIDDLT